MGGDPSVAVADGEIPEETAGPFPGDGSNGVNVLSESGIVRSDLTSSFGSASGVAEGVPVTVKLKVHDLNGTDVTPLAGAALYLWHCDREGRYSMYSDGVTDENYLRGVQETAADGSVEFTTVFPACYDGRWPHMHFEVYRSLDSATSYSNKLRTSQLAIPEDSCREVYGVVDGYDASVDNLDRVSLDSDMRLQRRLLAPARDRDRLGRRGVHLLPQRPGVGSSRGPATAWQVPSALPEGEPAPSDGSLPDSALAELGQRPFGVYVHVPFCTVRCGYCDFNTYTVADLGTADRRARRLAHDVRRGRGRGGPAGPAGARRAGAGRDGLLRRRHPDAAQPGRPRCGAGRDRRPSSGWRRTRR